MEEACFVFRRILLACVNFTTNDFKEEHNRDMSEALSTLWSYVVTAVDMALNKQESKIKELEE